MNKNLFWLMIVFLMAGWFYPPLGLLAVICMLAPLVMAAYKGRFWCGNYCPRGSLYDNVLAPLSYGQPVPEFFTSKSFRVVALLIVFVVFGYNLYLVWPSLDGIGTLFIKMIIATTLIGVLLGLFFKERIWCNFCPMGTLANFLTPKTTPKLYVKESCVLCSMCVKACPMSLKPYTARGKMTGFKSNDCLRCGRCANICPKKAIVYKL